MFLEIKNCPILLFASCNCHKCIHKVSFMWQKSAYYCQIHRVICWLNDCPPAEVLLEPSSSLSNLNASHAGGISVSLDPVFSNILELPALLPDAGSHAFSLFPWLTLSLWWRMASKSFPRKAVWKAIFWDLEV